MTTKRTTKPSQHRSAPDLWEPDSLKRRVASLERQTEYRLSECHPDLQPVLREHLVDRVLANRRASSNGQWAHAWMRVSQSLDGRHPASLSPGDWKLMIHAWLTKTPGRDGRPGLSRSWVSAITIHVKSCLGRFYPDGKIPDEVRDALRVTKGGMKPRGRVLSDAEFNAMLEAAVHEPKAVKHPRLASMFTALLWCLWDTGMRISELLGLNIGDVEQDGEITCLRMRDDAPLQKTGPREVQALEVTRVLQVWLEMHPGNGNPAAPLFPILYDVTGTRRLGASQVDILLKRWSNAAGINRSGYKPVSAHDFRHTRMTRLARANWHPSKIEAVAGWAPGSDMTAHYVHIASKDIREQLLRDAGLDEQGYRQLMENGNEAAALAELLQRILAKTKGQGLSTAKHLLGGP